MKQTSDLFDLIKSLSKSEKRYFKLHSSFHSNINNKYLVLFDLLDKQSTYNEAGIKDYFKNDPSANQLNVLKNYLYNQILKALRRFHSNYFPDIQLRDQLNNILVLNEKLLFSQSLKIISKGKKMAGPNGNDLFRLVLINLEEDILRQQSDFKSLNSVITENFDEKLNIIERLKDTVLLQNLHQQLLIFVDDRKKTSLDVDQLIKECLSFHKPEEDLSSVARLTRYNILAIKYNHLFPNEEMLAGFIELIRDHESHKGLLQKNISVYLTGVKNLLHCFVIKQSYKAFFKQLNNFRQVLKQYSHHAEFHQIHSVALGLELKVYRQTSQIEEGKELLNQVESYYENVLAGSLGSYRFGLFIEAGSFYLLLNDLGAAETWFQRVNTESGRFIKYELLLFSKMMLSIIHFECNNETLAESYLKSALSLKYKEKELFPELKDLLLIIKKTYSLEPRQAQAYLSDQSEAIAEVAGSSRLDLSSVTAWIQSKIKECSLLEAYQLSHA